MLFNSIEFAIFFPIVVFLYFLLPYGRRWMLLLSASFIFYMAWKPAYIVLVIFSTLLDYLVAIAIEKSTGRPAKRFFLFSSLVGNLGLLFFFKYYNFFGGELNALLKYLMPGYELPFSSFLLPVGISFYTFQTMSYTIDVFRGVQQAEHHLGRFALYVTFFPQLVAGPIERPGNLLPQLSGRYDFNYDRVTSGIKLMAWGLFKKIVIADRLALLVNRAYNDPSSYDGVSLSIATFCFAFQIYCDFSGYSDIAIGVARVMGVNLMKNFERPYYSKSIGEFWHRWHISLSTWFRDYLYVTLGGNRVSIPRWYLNLFTVFVISGLWHGANWTFLIWGALHGFYLIVGILSAGFRKRCAEISGLSACPLLHKCIKMGCTFLIVCFAWVFFRANSLSDALMILVKIIRIPREFDPSNLMQSITIGMPFTFALSLLFITVLESYQLLERKGDVWQKISSKPALLRWSVYYMLMLCILGFGVYDQTAFIYFQF